MPFSSRAIKEDSSSSQIENYVSFAKLQTSVLRTRKNKSFKLMFDLAVIFDQHLVVVP